MTASSVQWVDAREHHPREGLTVLGATTGRYPSRPGRGSSEAEDFWLVVPMHFESAHRVEVGGAVVLDCFVDSDRVVRRAFGVAPGEESVTHWALLPSLPGVTRALLTGADVQPALRRAGVEPGI